MVNGAHARKVLAATLKITDGDVMNVGEIPVELAQIFYVRVMDGVDERGLYKTRIGKARRVVEVNDVTGVVCRVTYGPGGMCDVLKIVVYVPPERPLWIRVHPTLLNINGRGADRIHHNLYTPLFKLECKIANE